MSELAKVFAAEIGNWPEEAVRASFSADMQIYFEMSDGSIFVSDKFTRGVDSSPYSVTRAQWEAERARILAESQPERDEFIKELVDAACGKRSQYEQELWDKVAVAAMQSLTSSYWESQDAFEDAKALVKCQCESACEYADAFMVERAKRLKK